MVIDWYRILCHTMRTLRESQTYSQNLKESSHFSETISNFFVDFQRISQCGSTGGLHRNERDSNTVAIGIFTWL